MTTTKAKPRRATTPPRATTAPRSAAHQPKAKGLSDTQRWAYGLVLMAVSAYLIASILSFFLFWRDDQAIACFAEGIADGEGVVRNWCGPMGVRVANFLVSKWFGLFAFCIPVMLGVIALRIMRFQAKVFRKSVRLTLILMILGSLSLGYLFGEAWGVFGSGLGGAQGIAMARWLNSLIGFMGTGLLLLCAIIIYAIYINRNTIGFLNRVGKDVVNGGKKVGGVVSSTASTLINHEPREVEITYQENPEQSPQQSSPLPKSQSSDTPFVVETTAIESSEASSTIASHSPRTYTDANGFEVTAVGEGFYDETPQSNDSSVDDQHYTYIDDDGFVIEGRKSMDQAPAGGGTTPAVGTVELDENGFVVESPTPSYEEVATPIKIAQPTYDVNGFLVEGATEEFVAAVPATAAVDPSDEFIIERVAGEQVLSDEEIEQAHYDPTLDLSSYQRPSIDLLEDHSVEVSVSSDEIVENKNRIKVTLENFGIKIDKIKATIGPTVTLYEIVPAPGVRISKIKNLEDDIALSLSALGIRIIAPIPGKGTIGIEVPNKDKQIVSMHSVIKSARFQDSTAEIPVALGKTIQDETFVIDLAKMPHLLVAGATGQGKSVGLNAIITSLLYKKHPSELKLVLVDPKKVELTLYGKLERHFLAKMPGEDDAIITDTHKVIYTLNSLCVEMDARYDLLRKAEVRHVKEYNEKFKKRRLNPEKGHRFLPYIVVIIDEFADLIMTAGREVETPIARIAQLARAVGIHLVIATQRPTTNIITGVIKANFPARIAFRVTSMIDSRTILDQSGANQLIGRGDMLVSTGNDVIRVQCAFVDTPEIEKITEFVGEQRGYVGAYELPEYVPEGADGATGGNRTNDLSQLDGMFNEVALFVVQNQQGSTSAIQRRFSIGYNRAGRIMDQLEMAGVVGSSNGSKSREVLITDVLSLEHLLSNLD